MYTYVKRLRAILLISGATQINCIIIIDTRPILRPILRYTYNRVFPSESLVRVSRMCITTFSNDIVTAT